MARTKDRHIISEVIRVQDLWRTEDLSAKSITLMTDYDERLEIYYGNVGQVLFAEYIHWDSSDPSREVMHEMIRKNKRKRVLELLQAERGRDGHLYVKVEGYEWRVRVGSIFEGIYHSHRPKKVTA